MLQHADGTMELDEDSLRWLRNRAEELERECIIHSVDLPVIGKFIKTLIRAKTVIEPPQIRYKRLRRRRRMCQDEMDKLGKGGWELCAITPHDECDVEYVFIRRLWR